MKLDDKLAVAVLRLRQTVNNPKRYFEYLLNGRDAIEWVSCIS